MIAFIVLTLASGMLLSLQQMMGAALGVRVGSMGSSLINHLGGAFFAGVFLIVGVRMGTFHFSGIPVVYFLGGCLGIMTVACSNFAIVHIGVVMMSILLVSSQLATSLLIDHFGGLGATPVPFTFLRGVGIALLIVGAVLVFKQKRTSVFLPTLEKISPEILP